VGMISTTIVGLLGTFLAARRVGRMVDRYGIKRMLMLGHFFWAILPLIWLFATPPNAWFWIGLANLVGGAFPAAANNAGVKLVTRFARPEESAMYMAVSTTIGSFCAGLGSIVAGTFLNVVGDWSFTVVGLAVSGFPMLFLISGALRLVTVFTLIPRIKVTGARPEEDQPFLLPLFFESLPGISRLSRTSRRK
jgi:MFS family permease